MSTAVVEPPATDPGGPAPKPLTTGKQPIGIMIALWLFVTLPFVALLTAVPVMWGWGLNWIDVVVFVVFYAIGVWPVETVNVNPSGLPPSIRYCFALATSRLIGGIELS